MKIFEILNYQPTITAEALIIPEFKSVWIRDKSKEKDKALLDLLFVYLFCDSKSDYSYISDLKTREFEIKKDLRFEDSWTIDDKIQAAIEFYNSKETILEGLYKGAVKAVNDVKEYLNKTSALLNERTEKGQVVTSLPQITAALKSVPIIMRDLKAAEKELIKEKKDSDGKAKGSRNFNTFEEGLSFE